MEPAQPGTPAWLVMAHDARMARLRICNLARSAGSLSIAGGRTVATRAYVADHVVARLVGMLGTPDPSDDEILVLVPCAAVHGVGLRASIGAAFVDPTGRVLRVVDPLPRRGASCWGAHAVIEAASGVLAVGPGDRVQLGDGSVFPHGGTFPG